MKKFIPILFLFISLPVFADTTIPITPAVADFMITIIRPASYTARTPQCKTDGILLKAIGKDYYASNMNKVEAWKVEIEKTRKLTINEKKDYDQVKSIFELEKKSPRAPTWKICDVAMTSFISNIKSLASNYSKNKSIILDEYKATNLIASTNGIQVFTSPSLNTQIAVINQKDIKKYQTELIKFEYVIKIKSSSMTLMMKNDIVNNRVASFYENPVSSVSILSFQKIYNWYVISGNSKYTDYGEPAPYPISIKVGSIYYIEM